MLVLSIHGFEISAKKFEILLTPAKKRIKTELKQDYYRYRDLKEITILINVEMSLGSKFFVGFFVSLNNNCLLS